MCSLVKEVNEEEFPDLKTSKTTQLTVGAHLSQQQKQEMEQVLSEFEDVLQAKPGQTSVAEHVINTDAKPICLPAYRISHAYREAVTKELQEMKKVAA